MQATPRLRAITVIVLVTGASAHAEIAGIQLLGTLLETGARDRAVFATYAPGREDELFVVEQRGIVHRLDLTTGQLDATPFLDIRSLVDSGGNEQGLLGLAFHPDYATNGYFYVNYTRDPGLGRDRTRIDRFEAASPLTSTTVSTSTRSSVLEFEQDFSNHNGGWIGFSPNDGYLYIASGDGGSGNDPNNRGQTLNTLLGKMLRIDVDGDDFVGNATRNYAIPDDNPFVDGNANTFDEIWAYGLRNPFRASFDRDTGDLWIGDVGQGAREEINFQAGDSEGGENYGWRLREGDIQTPGRVGGAPPPDNVDPVYDYLSNGSGAFGGNSVVGGYVYRGPDPEVEGRYFFGDTFPTQLWTFDPSDPDGTVANVESILNPAGQISTPVSFAEDAVGNLYLLTGADPGRGQIYRVLTDALRAGDFDTDGDVNEDDLRVWASNFGLLESLADGNEDGTVDAADFVIWRDSTVSQPVIGALSVPEPSALALGFLSTMTIANSRRRRTTG